jgi:hypothetical protein
MHVLPRVRELERRFGERLVVIGVHAGKFSAERLTRNLAAACSRLGVRHAVVNDRQYRIWKAYGIQAWPTVALIDSAGALVGVQSGEFPVEEMAAAVDAVDERDRKRGVLVEGCDPARPPVETDVDALRFPTRVIADGGRMWVSDAGHARVCELAPADRGGWHVVGSWDGLAEPQGLVRLGGRTYVADRAAHSIFRLDEDGLTRIAGSGNIGAYRLSPGPALSVDLRSPWGLSPLPNGDLAIAMAGSHQLWHLAHDVNGDFEDAHLSLLAGAGGEDILDGPAEGSLLAQPSGLALGTGGMLAFADSESSAVRLLDPATAVVRTIVGTGLFDFGDRDGTGDRVLLQHPLDLAWRDDDLIVVDTYNDRVKRVESATGRCEAHHGQAGEAGVLWEPMGISAIGGNMLVADTNNHRIVTIAEDGAVTPLRVEEQ